MPSRFRLLLALLPIGICTTPLMGQVSPAWSQCRSDTLSTFNCARYYSGTVTAVSQLKTPNGPLADSVMVTVTAGRASCRMHGTEVENFEGQGMIAVQHDNTADAGDYEIIVWCPETAGERPGRHDSPTLDIQHQRATDYATLAGKDSYEHPEADAVNGITGTYTITWSLKKN